MTSVTKKYYKPRKPGYCSGCAYFQAVVPDEEGAPVASGRCLRYPPTVDGKVPQVPARYWCGEYRGRVGAKPKR